MSDKASKKTDKQILKLDKQIDEVYSEAKKDLENKFDTFKKKLSVKMDIKEQEFKDGKITQSEFNNWMKQYEYEKMMEEMKNY